MKQNNLISIVVPICNTASYLEKCLKSIMSQTYSNLEIILVNNIKYEDTGIICNKCASIDNRIHVINVPNISVGAARNIGIENANGEYIGFVDSDDYIEKDMYEVLLTNLIDYNADISSIGFCYETEGKILEKEFTNKVETFGKVEAIQEVLKDKKIQSFVWNKLFTREMWDNIRFNEERVFEDIDVMYRIFQKVNKFVLIDIQKYIYVQRENSIMHKRNSQYVLDRLNVVVHRYDDISNMKEDKLNFANAYAFAVNMIVMFRSIVLKEYDDIYKEFMKYFDLFIEIVNKYNTQIIELLTPNQKIVLNFMLEDIKNAPKKIQEIKGIEQ